MSWKLLHSAPGLAERSTAIEGGIKASLASGIARFHRAKIVDVPECESDAARQRLNAT